MLRFAWKIYLHDDFWAFSVSSYQKSLFEVPVDNVTSGCVWNGGFRFLSFRKQWNWIVSWVEASSSWPLDTSTDHSYDIFQKLFHSQSEFVLQLKQQS